MNDTTSDSCNQSQNHFQFQPPSQFDIFTGALMILIIVTSLAGNILVCYAFMSNSRLRVVTNYFIMNLAISDILTASLVIAFDADMKLHGLSSWRYGVVMCKIWTTTYTISVPTSILTLCVVSIDRYQAISDPLGYRAGVTLSTTKALCLIAGIWGLSLFMAFLPLIAGSPLNETLSRDLAPNCPNVHFCYFDISPSYSAGVTIIAFILPSILMAILYVKMYIIITYKRYISDETEVGHGMKMSNRTGSNKTERDKFEDDIDENRDNARNESHRVENESSQINEDSNNNPDLIPNLNTNCNPDAYIHPNHGCNPNSFLTPAANVHRNEATNPSCSIHPYPNSTQIPSHANRGNANTKKDRNELTGSKTALQSRQHHSAYQTKVARHFSVIVLVQLLCWYPFSVANLVYNLCDNCYHISSSAQYFLLTIGYMTCAINPYLYAYQQRSFRQVFNRILRLKV